MATLPGGADGHRQGAVREEGVGGEAAGVSHGCLSGLAKKGARASGSIVPRIWAGNEGAGTDLGKLQAGVLRSWRTMAKCRQVESLRALFGAIRLTQRCYCRC